MKPAISTAAIILLFSIIAQPSIALADGASAILNGRSFHLDSSYDWNENNAGAGFEYDFNSGSVWRKTVMANAFRDSTDNMSYMAGAGIHRRLYETHHLSGFYVDAGINAFLMVRDDVGNSKPFPGLLPSVTVGNDVLGFNLTYLPRAAVESTTRSTMVDPTISGILFLQFKVSMDALLPQGRN